MPTSRDIAKVIEFSSVTARQGEHGEDLPGDEEHGDERRLPEVGYDQRPFSAERQEGRKHDGYG